MTERLISSELCTIPMNALKGGEKGVRAQRGNSTYEVIFVLKESVTNQMYLAFFPLYVFYSYFFPLWFIIGY